MLGIKIKFSNNESFTFKRNNNKKIDNFHENGYFQHWSKLKSITKSKKHQKIFFHLIGCM